MIKAKCLCVLAAAGLFGCALNVSPFAAAPVSAATAPDAPEARPYDAARDAMADVDAALDRAAARNVNALLVLGANWCHDSRGFAGMLEAEESLAALVAEHYEVAFVDVGMRDRNLDVAQRFGVDEIIGTPTILIVSPGGALLNGSSVHRWRAAASDAPEFIRGYLAAFATLESPALP